MKTLFTTDALLVRETSDVLKYTRTIDEIPGGPLTRLLPLARFTWALLGPLRAPLRLDAIHHGMYSQYRYPRYGRIAHRTGAAVERLGRGFWQFLSGRPAS